MANRPPVDEITRMMKAHAGKPLERARRDIVVIIHPHDRRIRVKPRQHRILDQAQAAHRAPPCPAAARIFRLRTPTSQSARPAEPITVPMMRKLARPPQPFGIRASRKMKPPYT